VFCLSRSCGEGERGEQGERVVNARSRGRVVRTEAGVRIVKMSVVLVSIRLCKMWFEKSRIRFVGMLYDEFYLATGLLVSLVVTVVWL
jgi:hypothetical protein